LKIDKNVIYQDNQAAMLLEKNGKASSSKRTRALNICFFHVKDQLELGTVTGIEYCVTSEILGDYWTKPLVGAAFHKHWKWLMGIEDEKEV